MTLHDHAVLFCSGKPPGAARGGDGEHGNEQGAGDCEPGAASAAGLGRGEVNERRPQADLPLGGWPNGCRAAKEELRVADVRLSRLEHKAQPCAPLPAMPTRGGARHNANYTH
ncbi:hypothetical protein [Photorhabdus sp. SF281]|uniref:hypothetical protein n=1 Tax=Photorhabdus sp. SF281 TaxID=3459527 RepID=UPI004044472C